MRYGGGGYDYLSRVLPFEQKENVVNQSATLEPKQNAEPFLNNSVLVRDEYKTVSVIILTLKI